MHVMASSCVMSFYERVKFALQKPITMMEHGFVLLTSLLHKPTMSRKLAVDRRLQAESADTKMLLTKEDASELRVYTERWRALSVITNFDLQASAEKESTKAVPRVKEKVMVENQTFHRIPRYLPANLRTVADTLTVRTADGKFTETL